MSCPGQSAVDRAFHKKVGAVLREHDMLCSGDRVLVAVSGGKDSLSMLHVLLAKKSYIPVDFELHALHVLSGPSGADQPRKERLKEVFERLDVPYSFRDVRDDGSSGERRKSSCFWCAWTRRKTLFEAAEEMGFNKVALGHNMDDIAQTVLLNLVFNGNISSMKPVQGLFDGRLTLIRPLAEVTEEDAKAYAREKDLLFPEPECGIGARSKRAVIKGVIEQLAADNPEVRSNIVRAPGRIRSEYITEYE